jgi:hypothetical protein
MNVFALVLGIGNGLFAIADYHYGTIDGLSLFTAFFAGGLITMAIVGYDRDGDE